MEAVIKLLGLGTLDVRFVVIHGIGGIGKTTLAKAIFERISSQFQSCSFLLDIRGNDILTLRKKLSRDILGLQHSKVIDAYERRDMIEERLHDKKVILILDDMDKKDQLMKLAGESSWFGPGSRIIITTRNTHFLAPQTDYQDDNIIPLNHQDFYFYEMKIMELGHALQLFSKHSFKSDSPPRDYVNISCEFVNTSGGLPLALEVIGSFLHLRSMRTWKDTLKKLQTIPNTEVKKKLLISYEELDFSQQQIFLDIACHFIGEKESTHITCGKLVIFSTSFGLNVLIHLSLIKVNEDDRLWMHNQLGDLGREIVEQECVRNPEERSRLWCPKTASNVIQNNLGTKNIVALKLTRLDDEHNFTSGEFSRLPSLRFLELDGGNFVGDFKNLLFNLTWLCWRHCPSELHATGLRLKKLTVLKLSESDIMEDWNGWGACMVNDNLKVIYLESCNYLKRTPNFSKCLNLKRLVLKNCTRLEEIDSSINQLGHLKYLELDGMDRPLQRIPPISLLPYAIDGMKSLSVLKVEKQDGIRELPPSIEGLQVLKHMSLSGCCNFVELLIPLES
ncbi:TMV resistance protein N-like [Eucalyptus grandis]|uniref:TMV resistance protein N-like n=1 Tax=Eucalyptus grandis TaxID=71139 RepID=UPI00192E7F35|nr:TMV resistance protein N-like [Eucalyptus grandis]